MGFFTWVIYLLVVSATIAANIYMANIIVRLRQDIMYIRKTLKDVLDKRKGEDEDKEEGEGEGEGEEKGSN